MDIKQISLNDIDLSSQSHDRFLFSYARDLDVTMDSIKKVGLINPVILNHKSTVTMRRTLLYVVINASRHLRN